MPEMIYKIYEPKDDQPRRIIAAISSETIDRDGEIVAAAAVKAAMDGFMKNPVVMTYHKHAHEDGTPTVIGKVIKWWQEKGATLCEIEFADTELGQEYWRLYSGKYQRAFSIGFTTLKSEQRYVGSQMVKVHTAIDLYEISAVGVPSNPDAITKGAKTDDITKSIHAAIDSRFKNFESFLVDQLDQVKDMLHGGTPGYADNSLGELSDLSEAGAEAEHAETVLNRIQKKLNESRV
jgi:hypothetical protein